MINNVRKLTRYIVWCGAYTFYRPPSESGDAGKMLLCLIYVFFFFSAYSFMHVWAVGHQSIDVICGGTFAGIVKLIFLAVGAAIYYLVHKRFKNYPILKNTEFSHISNKTRRFHIVCIYLFLAFEFYILLVIMSPSFHPSKLF